MKKVLEEAVDALVIDMAAHNNKLPLGIQLGQKKKYYLDLFRILEYVDCLPYIVS